MFFYFKSLYSHTTWGHGERIGDVVDWFEEKKKVSLEWSPLKVPVPCQYLLWQSAESDFLI